MAKETLEQRRARDAWEKSARFKEDHVKEYKKYANIAQSLPALIMNSGLMQAMAFMQEKGEKDEAYKRVAADLRKWLHGRFGTDKKNFEKYKECMECLFNEDSQEFQQITLEAFAWLKWRKLMASAQQGQPQQQEQ